MASATQPTRRPWHSGDDGLWANAAAAGDTESSPSNGEVDAGHLNNTGLTSGRLNWFHAMIGEWLQKVRDVLLPQHQDDGSHWEVEVYGADGAPKLTVHGTSGEASSSLLLDLYNGAGTQVGSITAAGALQLDGGIQATGSIQTAADMTVGGFLGVTGAIGGLTVEQTDSTNRKEVIPGSVGILISSGTRAETGGSLGYDENDSTVRVIRYFIGSKLPEHAILRTVDVQTYHGNAANEATAEVWNTDATLGSGRVSRGSTTTVTGVTGYQSASLTPSGTLTQAGARGWWVDVSVKNANANGVYVDKLVVDYDVTRL